MTTPRSGEQHQLDLGPFQIFVPVPPMLAEACGYSGQVFGHSLAARFVGFYWGREGDEANFCDGKSSGTGEWTGFLAFVRHWRIAPHLKDYDWGSSETLPRHMLVVDQVEHRLYGLPVQLAQHFLDQQWRGQQDSPPEPVGTLHIETLDDLAAALESRNWQEVTPPDDIDVRVAAAMQRQSQLLNELTEWLYQQQRPLIPERIAEYNAPSYAMLLIHVSAAGAFAQAGELVHLQEVRESGAKQVTVSFYRDNGIDGPDKGHLFAVSGAWQDMVEMLEPLLESAQLDDLLEGKTDLSQVFGRYAAWNGRAFPIVPMRETLAIRVALPCARCGRNPTTAYARSGLHRGAFSCIYDFRGEYQADLRNQEYVCPRCEKTRSGNDTSPDEDAQD